MIGVDVAAIRARADAATEGPWFREYGDVVLASDDPRDVAEGYDEPRGERVFRRAPHRGLRDDQAIADATFAQHARTDVPALLDALAEAEWQRDEALAKIAGARVALQTNVRWPIEEGSGSSITWREAILRVDAILEDARAALTDPHPRTATVAHETAQPRVPGTTGPQNRSQGRGSAG